MRYYKKSRLIILTVFIISNYSNDDDNHEIVGEWKLMDASLIDFSSIPSIDYSTINIRYNF